MDNKDFETFTYYFSGINIPHITGIRSTLGGAEHALGLILRNFLYNGTGYEQVNTLEVRGPAGKVLLDKTKIIKRFTN